MLITIIILAVLLFINLAATVKLIVRYGNQSADFEKLSKDFTDIQTEFAIIGGLLAPFLQWVDDVNKQRATMERLAKEKADALANQKKE